MAGLLVAACRDGGTPLVADTSSDGGGAVADAAPGNATGMDASAAGAAPAPPPSILPLFDGGWPFLPRVCALRVGAECDGDEDCPDAETCCATFDAVTFSYSSITCRTQCEPPAGFRLCHPGDECADPAHECRFSQIVPHNFIQVCYEPTEPPVGSRSRSLAGEVVCGQATCPAGEQKCCLRAWFHFADNSRTTLEPYCAPLDDPCDCSDEPPPLHPLPDAEVPDAQASDAGPPDEADAGDEDAG